MGWQALYMESPGDPQPTGVYNPGDLLGYYKLLELGHFTLVRPLYVSCVGGYL
jgi:hypothetical protein